jgi:archaellum component FlaG (FlaF/FlaG flagellin family)
MITIRTTLIAAAVILLLASSVHAATWYVTQSGTGDATTIQAGIDLSSPGDTVLVAPGTYTDTLHVTIQGEEKVANVHLTKDIALIAEGDTTNTVIDGPESDVAVFVEGVGSSGLIEGFRVQTHFEAFLCLDARSALELLTTSGPPPGFRVGVWCESSSVLIQRCAFEDHGIAVELYTSPVTIRECRIGWTFSGVECLSGSDAVIEHNRFYWIAGGVQCEASSPTITENDMGGGGEMCRAVACGADADAYIARNRFQDIRPQTIHVGPAAPIIEDNLFINGSQAIFISAGNRSPVVRNNIFYDHGSWIIETRYCASVIEYNTIDYAPGTNTRGIEVQGGSPVIRNNVISRISAGISCGTGSTPTIECNDVYMASYPYHDQCTDQTGINGNISVDPQFCGVWDTIDYRLQSDSPCAPGNHPDGYDCGQIGAKGVGCSTTPTKRKSWGAMKALYKGKERK